MPSERNSLVDLPVELIEIIALILWPRYIDLFRVDCSLSETLLWTNLRERPFYAALIRYLVIDPRLDSRPKGRVPPWMRADFTLPTSSSFNSLSGGTTEEQSEEDRISRIAALTRSTSSPTIESETEDEANFVNALRHMTNLSKLVWRHNPPHQGDQLWNTLIKHCSNITDLEIADRDSGVFRGDRKIRDALPSIHLSKLASGLNSFNLTRLVWYTSAADSSDFLISKLGPIEQALVNGCPYLEELRIRQCLPQSVFYAGSLLSRAHWPRLRILELSHAHAGDCEAVARFFDRHPLIHTLILEQADFTSGVFVDLDEVRDDALVNLEVLCAGIDNVNALLRAGAGVGPGSSSGRSEGRTRLRKVYGLQFDTPMKRARRPSTWSSSGEGARLLDGLARTTSLRELEGEFAIVISDKLDLVRLFASCAHLTHIKISCSFAGLLESFLPAFAFLTKVQTLDMPLQHFDVLPTASASTSHNSLTMRMGTGTGYISTGTRAASGSTPWGGFATASGSPARLFVGGAGSSAGAGGMTFVAGLQRKVKMVADVCPELVEVRFGSAVSGVAKVVRYHGSTEVSHVELVGAGPFMSSGSGGGCDAEPVQSDLWLTQCKASGWAPYGTTVGPGGQPS
ncbi:hypothetical protein OC846_000925 [Tilletia horrida]|uniref:F-box domain-containing protein n=1 Tax=Tilletia horrida TaxID=155126 RepID=A0AAN6GU60_9BASI|nr:hypothetical protein OC846_000925 [Tilletia horrida]